MLAKENSNRGLRIRKPRGYHTSIRPILAELGQNLALQLQEDKVQEANDPEDPLHMQDFELHYSDDENWYDMHDRDDMSDAEEGVRTLA
ncbi:hypothetical protein V6N12_007713 [Hibiscus sabdariffa]|uniref:Uncharacterized protein n=1 Tax=Hibiscus sabdariffa TaxID=183260 RepID=A0ABR2F2K2_9ROSI